MTITIGTKKPILLVKEFIMKNEYYIKYSFDYDDVYT